MDKYEYRLKTEHIRQVAARKDYAAAARLCDSIDWNKVRDVKMLSIVADIYTAVGRYREAIDALTQAYDYAPIGRRIVYRLTELALEADDYEDAKAYFDEFCRIAPHDQGRYILLYRMACSQHATVAEKIKILEAYKREDFDEKWAYELATLYARSCQTDKCVQLCDDIILWFGLGKYVEKALNLKARYAPLTEEQKEKARKLQEEKENQQYEVRKKEIQQIQGVPDSVKELQVDTELDAVGKVTAEAVRSIEKEAAKQKTVQKQEAGQEKELKLPRFKRAPEVNITRLDDDARDVKRDTDAAAAVSGSSRKLSKLIADSRQSAGAASGYPEEMAERFQAVKKEFDVSRAQVPEGPVSGNSIQQYMKENAGAPLSDEAPTKTDLYRQEPGDTRTDIWQSVPVISETREVIEYAEEIALESTEPEKADTEADGRESQAVQEEYDFSGAEMYKETRGGEECSHTDDRKAGSFWDYEDVDEYESEDGADLFDEDDEFEPEADEYDDADEYEAEEEPKEYEDAEEYGTEEEPEEYEDAEEYGTEEEPEEYEDAEEYGTEEEPEEYEDAEEYGTEEEPEEYEDAEEYGTEEEPEEYEDAEEYGTEEEPKEYEEPEEYGKAASEAYESVLKYEPEEMSAGYEEADVVEIELTDSEAAFEYDYGDAIEYEEEHSECELPGAEPNKPESEAGEETSGPEEPASEESESEKFQTDESDEDGSDAEKSDADEFEPGEPDADKSDSEESELEPEEPEPEKSVPEERDSDAYESDKNQPDWKEDDEYQWGEDQADEFETDEYQSEEFEEESDSKQETDLPYDQSNGPRINPPDLSRVWHFAVNVPEGESPLQTAMEYVRQVGEYTVRPIPEHAARVTGAQLNSKDLIQSFDKLLGKIIIVINAGEMEKRIVDEFCKVLEPSDRSLMVVLADNEKRLSRLFADYPQLTDIFTAQFMETHYTAAELLEYAKEYADGQDSVLNKGAELCLIEQLETVAASCSDKDKKRTVERIINQAIESAEQKSLKHSLRHLFSVRYDKEGRLILTEKNFE